MKALSPLPAPPTDSWVLEQITRAFEKQYGRSPSDLPSDLVLMSDVFNPSRSGASIRERLTRVRAVDGVDGIGEPWLIVLLNGAAIVTPEGRAALDANGAPTWPPAVIAHLLDFYRLVSQEKLRKITALLRGDGPLAHPAALAAVLLLLINRSTSPERAIPRDVDTVLDQAIQAVHQAFITTLVPGSKASKKEMSFRSGYGVTEAARRLGPNVIAIGSEVFIHPGEERRAVQMVSKELRRRAPKRGEAMDAFDALLAEYHRQRSTLSAAGCAFERASTTASLRDMIKSEIETLHAESSTHPDSGFH